MRTFIDTGARLRDVADLKFTPGDDTTTRRTTSTSTSTRACCALAKGRRLRILPIGSRTVRAIDRCVRLRVDHPAAENAPWPDCLRSARGTPTVEPSSLVRSVPARPCSAGFALRLAPQVGRVLNNRMQEPAKHGPEDSPCRSPRSTTKPDPSCGTRSACTPGLRRLPLASVAWSHSSTSSSSRCEAFPGEARRRSANSPSGCSSATTAPWRARRPQTILFIRSVSLPTARAA